MTVFLVMIWNINLFVHSESVMDTESIQDITGSKTEWEVPLR